MQKESKLRSFEEYADFYSSKVNNKELVMKNTYNLNSLLHELGVAEKLRSQFVGTCLLALKNNMAYEGITNIQIRSGIKEVLSKLLDDDLKKAEKLVVLNSKILESQDIRSLSDGDFRRVLNFIKNEILPFINDRSTAGQDLLNLFFIQFNKYVGKEDKNQAFTPDHITDFMVKAIGINRNSRVLDPCCGSGSFLVRAMTQAMDDCASAEEQEKVKKEHIYGIEYEETAFGLATTNMLIHSDGNTNIIQGSCFDYEDWIKKANIDRVLMNPPFNAQKKHVAKEYSDTWPINKKKKLEDPSKGLCFVKYTADAVGRGKLAVLLPMQCAIGTGKEIENMKMDMLNEHTLDAVFSLPSDIFHPGTSVPVCCMIFNLGIRHNDKQNLPTFFGYYKDDGFTKKKNLGRVEKIDKNTSKGMWENIEKKWLELYRTREVVDGFSAIKTVTYKDECKRQTMTHRYPV